MSLHVGCRAVDTFDPLQHAHVSAWILYPTLVAPRSVRFGPYRAELAADAPAHVLPRGRSQRTELPLVAFSHGNGSTPWVHCELAMHLAREGFAVLMIEHPGNNRSDNSLGVAGGAGRVKAVLLEHRPRHVRLAADAAFADGLVGPRLASSAYAIVGESIGAYTALALAGGHALTIPDDVADSRLAAPLDELAKLAFPVPVRPDPRVRAAVLLSPAIGFFMPDGALSDVDIPLLVRTGACDRLCPTAQVMLCLRSLPDPTQLQHIEVNGAGHFSFQSAYPPELTGLMSAQDPGGFDREAYQQTLKRDVTTFLRAAWSLA